MTPSPLHRPDLPAYALAALCVVGIIILAALHIAIPSVLSDIAIAGGVGGVALPSQPRGQRAADTTTRGRSNG